jgi:hypothetical protein
VRDAIKAVRAINSQTPRGEGSGGRRRFMFRRGWVMIVAGRKTSPAVVVCVCVFMVYWCDRLSLPLRIHPPLARSLSFLPYGLSFRRAWAFQTRRISAASSSGVLGISFMVLVLVRRRKMCRCNRNGLLVRPIAHLWMVRAARQSGGGLRLVGSWRGDCGVCRDSVQNKKYPFHYFPIQAGKLGCGDSASVEMPGDLFLTLGEFLASLGGADAV